MGDFVELVKFLAQSGWAVAGAVIIWDFWRYATGRAVPLRRYQEMQEDRDYWRASAVHGQHQVTTLVDNKDIGLAFVESVVSDIEEKHETT